MRNAVTFCALVVLLSVPFWLVGAVVDLGPPAIPIDLPLSSLQFVCPLIAAVILVGRDDGPGGIRKLLLRAVDLRALTPRIWYLPVILLMPAVLALSYGVLRLAGSPLPEPDIPILAIPAFFGVFLLAAVFEETGWSGYVLQPFQDRWGAAGGGVVLGSLWGAWHVVGWYVQGGHTLTWTAGQFVGSIALRVLIVWLYNATGGSVLAAVLFHDMINVGEFLFPNYGSHYDPGVTAAILALVAALVTLLRGPPHWGARHRRRRPAGVPTPGDQWPQRRTPRAP